MYSLFSIRHLIFYIKKRHDVLRHHIFTQNCIDYRVSKFDNNTNNSIIIITTCNQINNWQLCTIGRYYTFIKAYNLLIIILFSKCELLVLYLKDKNMKTILWLQSTYIYYAFKFESLEEVFIFRYHIYYIHASRYSTNSRNAH